MSLGCGYGKAEVCLSIRILQNSSTTVARLCFRLLPHDGRFGRLHGPYYQHADGRAYDQESHCEGFGDYASSSVSEVCEPARKIANHRDTETRRKNNFVARCICALHRA